MKEEIGLPIYMITAYIPSDENIVVSDIKKITVISKEGHCVICSIKETGGIATGTPYPHSIFPDIESAILKGIKYREECFLIDRMSFEQAIEKEQEFINILNTQLKK